MNPLYGNPYSPFGVKPPSTQKAIAVIVAGSSDLNDELAIAMSSIQESMEYVEDDDPIRPYLLDLRSALQRMAWKSSEMLNYASRNGGKAMGASLERIIEG
jgi:hypothetical protein